MKYIFGKLFSLLRFSMRRFYLIFFIIIKHFWRHFFSSIGLFVTLFIVVLILGALRPMKNMIVRKMEGSLPGEVLRLTPRQFQMPPLAFFSKQRDIALGISNYKINTMRKWPGVKEVNMTQVLQTPASAKIEHSLLKNMNWRFDIMLQGASDRLVKPYLKCMRNFRPQKYTDDSGVKMPMVPLLAPESYADIASAYAMINGLPPVQPESFLGVKIRIFLGRSVMGFQSKNQETIMGKICGFLPAGIVSTVAVPLNWVRSTHKNRNMRRAASHYDQVFVKVSDPKKIPSVVQKAKRMGLLTPKAKKQFNRLYSLLEKADWIFWGIAAVLLLLTSISLINAFTLLANEKKYEFGLYLVFGASPFFLWFIMFIEGAFWGALHGVGSVVAGSFFFPHIFETVKSLPMIANVAGSGDIALKFQLSFAEKTSIILMASLFSGVASLIPAILFLGKRTLTLVKKD